LWYRGKADPESAWKKIPFKGQYPVEIQADGANLVVVDAQKQVHYKKILYEYRKKGVYSYKDISGENNWEDRWFSFPIIEKIYHLFFRKPLQLFAGLKGCAISHRGLFNHFFVDLKGKKHPEFAMVTTLYGFIENTNYIVYADPYLMGGLKYKIEGPHPDFIIEAISASASVMFISGSLYGKRKRYTKRGDFDTMGKNLFLAGFWCKKSRSDPNWLEHPDLPEDATNNISIYQIGEGNEAFILQVPGIDGIYTKKINDNSWIKEPFDN
jgi:hypothetical protein